MARSYNERRHYRFVKGMRRVREDRREHGDSFNSCPCWSDEVSKGKGREFARFANHPAICSGWCCGNQRKVSGPTMQERRSAQISDW